MLNRVRLWIRSNVLRGRIEREMREEMDEHLERSVERLMGRGTGREETRRQARRELGNVTWLREEGRYARGNVWLDALAAGERSRCGWRSAPRVGRSYGSSSATGFG